MRKLIVSPLLATLALLANPASDTRTMADIKRQGHQLEVRAEVDQNVSIEAVVVPFEIAKRVFGKHVAESNVIVQLSISNTSGSAAFVLHNAYIDFSRVGAFSPSLNGNGGSPTNRVASIESRVARGQLLDAQQTTKRNITMRILTTVGSVAAGYTFSISNPDIAKGIAAFNGNVIPGVGYVWPDLTVAQLNRISDFGYQSNKLIPKQGSDIVVCFFPIANFLTPGFQKVFREAPAALFNPLQLLNDNDKRMRKILANNLTLNNNDIDQARAVLPCVQGFSSSTGFAALAGNSSLEQLAPVARKITSYCSAILEANPAGLTQLAFLKSLSFDNLLLKVDGVMTVDTREVPARIESVAFTSPAGAAFWQSPGDRTAEITGQFLTNGTVRILDAEDLGISDIATDPKRSTDTKLVFTFKMGKPIKADTRITLVVDRKYKLDDKNESTVTSSQFIHAVTYIAQAPSIAAVKPDGSTVTVTGKNFFDTPENKLAVRLVSGSGNVPVKPTLVDPAKLTFPLPDDLAIGCWAVELSVGAMSATSTTLIPKLPASRLNDASRNEGTLTVIGEGFINLEKCGKLEFRAVLDGAAGAISLRPRGTLEPTRAVFDLPEALRTGPWTLELWQADKERKPSLKIGQ